LVVVLGPITIAHSAFIHANLDRTRGPFKYVIASPERGGEKNFAVTFPVLLHFRHALHAEGRFAGPLWYCRHGNFRRASAPNSPIRSRASLPQRKSLRYRYLGLITGKSYGATKSLPPTREGRCC
jgi:hypothetical protein